MIFLRRWNDLRQALKKRSPSLYYFGWVILILGIFYLANTSFNELIFVVTLASFFILKISPRLALILSFFFLFLSSIFLTIFRDQSLAELLALYAYLLLGVGVAIQTRLFLRQAKNKAVQRLALKIFQGLNPSRIGLLIAFLLALILFQKIIITAGIIENGDLSFALYPERVLSTFRLWNDYGSVTGQTTPSLFPLAVVNRGISFLLGLSATFSIKLVLLEVICVGFFATYFLTQNILQKYAARKNSLALASSFAALFYLFNPYSLNRIFHLHIWIAYLFLPLILLLFIKLWETQKISYAAILAFILSFISFSPHYLVYALGALGLLTLVEIAHCLWQKRRENRRVPFLLKNLLNLLILFFCFLLFSSHWLIPFLKASLSTQEIAAPSYFLTQEYIENPSAKLQAIFETLTLQGEKTNSSTLNLFLKIFDFLLPLVLILPYLFFATWRLRSFHRKKMLQIFPRCLIPHFRNKWIIYFSLLGISAALISTMPIWDHALYQKIIFGLPYLQSFGWLLREPARINGLLALADTILLSFLLLKILNLPSPKKEQPLC